MNLRNTLKDCKDLNINLTVVPSGLLMCLTKPLWTFSPRKASVYNPLSSTN